MLLTFWLLLYVSTSTAVDMNDIIKELSWPLKLKILNEVDEPSKKVPHGKVDVGSPDAAEPDAGNLDGGNTDERNPSKEVMIEEEAFPHRGEKINITPDTEASKTSQNLELVEKRATAELNKLLNSNKELYRKNTEKAERRVGISLLRAGTETPQDENDEKDMRLKLFRLMYETVRDSDLKVKRAELIKEQYQNSSTFEIGYLIGDITDKANVITDISTTLKKFHREWKPLEHINAYEQISNQAIEITHLIDLVRVVHRREKGKSLK